MVLISGCCSLSCKFLGCFGSKFSSVLSGAELIILQTIKPISKAMPPMKFSAFYIENRDMVHTTIFL